MWNTTAEITPKCECVQQTSSVLLALDIQKYSFIGAYFLASILFNAQIISSSVSLFPLRDCLHLYLSVTQTGVEIDTFIEQE